MVREFLYRDDLDDTTENVRTLTYTLEGQDYEIDLSEENVQRFYSALEPFVTKSRQVKRHVSTGNGRRRGGDGRRSRTGSGRNDIPEVRAWAQANGFDVSERGRIKKEILDAYDDAHR